MLEAGVAVDACDVEMQTALYMAALNGQVKCVKTLLAAKANSNQYNLIN